MSTPAAEDAIHYPGRMPLTARYATTCGVCGSRISPGEEITDTGAAASVAGRTSAAHPGSSTSPATANRRSWNPWPLSRCGPTVPAPATPDLAGGPGRPRTAGRPRGVRPAPRTSGWRSRRCSRPYAHSDGPLLMVSDSTYVVNCFRDRWWQGWLARGWVTSAKKPVANRDLWEPLVTSSSGPAETSTSAGSRGTPATR